jgi:elongation factor Ts
MITKDLVKKLREETGHGIMDCKKALREANGNYQKAKEILSSKIEKISVEKSERETKAGLIETYTHDGKVGVILEVQCETDFVARNETFKNLVHDIVLQIASMSPKDIEDLLGQPYIRDESKIIKDIVSEVIAKTGENIKVVRFERYQLGEK